MEVYVSYKKRVIENTKHHLYLLRTQDYTSSVGIEKKN